MLYGVDVAHWQGFPNWTTVRRAGITFGFMKATQGTGFVDPNFQSNRKGCRDAGILPGYYHFADGSDVVAEANHFCDTVGSLAKYEMLALDWEVRAPNPPGWCKVFLDTVQKRMGVKPLIYMNKSTEAGFDWAPVVHGDYGLWLANYDYDPNNGFAKVKHWPFVAIEQYSDRTQTGGFSGLVDGDVFQGDIDVLRKYGFQGNTPVPPKPKPPTPPPFDVLRWRASYGATGHVFVNLQNWANRVFPSYAHINPVAPAYGPQTAAFLKQFAHRAATDPNYPPAGRHGDLGRADGRNIGNDMAAALYHYGFRG